MWRCVAQDDADELVHRDGPVVGRPEGQGLMTEQEEKDALVELVAPWLPHATVDTLVIEPSCGCYSEWTQEPPRYEVTFSVPRPANETDRKLSSVVSVLEGVVMVFALVNHEFTGCSSCCGDGESNDFDASNVRPSLWVRIIPVRASAQAGKPEAEPQP